MGACATGEGGAGGLAAVAAGFAGVLEGVLEGEVGFGGVCYCCGGGRGCDGGGVSWVGWVAWDDVLRGVFEYAYDSVRVIASHEERSLAFWPPWVVLL